MILTVAGSADPKRSGHHAYCAEQRCNAPERPEPPSISMTSSTPPARAMAFATVSSSVEFSFAPKAMTARTLAKANWLAIASGPRRRFTGKAMATEDAAMIAIMHSGIDGTTMATT